LALGVLIAALGFALRRVIYAAIELFERWRNRD
jgi:hypothetical protein